MASFSLFYMSAGFGAALIHQIATGVQAYMLFDSISPAVNWREMYIPVVGASGAVMGVVVAFGLLFPILACVCCFRLFLLPQNI